jgi:uncharacterized protein (DUF924 family)
MSQRIDDVLEYWFGPDLAGPIPDELSKRWFRGSEAFDREVRERFGPDVERAARGELEDWAGTPRGRLALVLLLDQFTRNIHRGDGRAFACDARARELALAGVERGDDRALPAAARSFLYMPLMHAEDLELQDRGVALFEALDRETSGGDHAKYARMHRDIIARFGRFPHRNARLGRESTEEEIEFLKQPGSSFG